MASDGVFARVEGLAEVRAALAAVPAKLRGKVTLRALRAAVRHVRDAARAKAPKLDRAAPAVKAGWRSPGTLRRAITVRTSGRDRREKNVGVFINVRPAKPGQRGARNPRDPFYWRWVEFGARHMAARPFLQAAVPALQTVAARFAREIGPAIARLNVRRTP